MIVCHCLGITDRELRGAVARGGDTLEEIERECDAGKACGGCRETVQTFIRVELLRRVACRPRVAPTLCASGGVREG